MSKKFKMINFGSPCGEIVEDLDGNEYQHNSEDAYVICFADMVDEGTHIPEGTEWQNVIIN